MIQPWLKETPKDLFFSKKDAADPRLGDFAQTPWDDSEITADAFCLLGYPDDEGIKLNGGRPGAAGGPEAIRRAFYKMTPSLSHAVAAPKIVDCGDVAPSAQTSLENRHRNARTTVSGLLAKGARVVTLGGGHDYGYPDMAAFCERVIAQKLKPAIINFDAHLDVRPDNKGFNSGTPFYRLLNEFAGQIDFFEVGIQDWCNSREHLAWARSKGASILTLSEINSSGTTLGEVLQNKILSKLTRSHKLALSVDIDAFASSAAPGASQVFPVGLNAQQFLVAWQAIHIQHRPQLASIYEVSPPFDLDQRTARLAAILIHQMLFA